MGDQGWTNNQFSNDFSASYTDAPMDWNTSAPLVQTGTHSESFSYPASGLNNTTPSSPYYHARTLAPAVTTQSATHPAPPFLSPCNEPVGFSGGPGGPPTSSTRISGKTAKSGLGKEVERVRSLVETLCDSLELPQSILDPDSTYDQQADVLLQTVEDIRCGIRPHWTAASPATGRKAGLSTAWRYQAETACARTACASCRSRKLGCDRHPQSSKTCTRCSKANRECIASPSFTASSLESAQIRLKLNTCRAIVRARDQVAI